MTINAGFSSAIFYAGWLVVTGVIRHVIRRAIRYRTLKLCCATSRLAHCIAIGNKSAHNTLISFIIRYEVLTSNYANNMAALNSSHRCIKKRALFFFFWIFFLLSLSLSLPFFLFCFLFWLMVIAYIHWLIWVCQRLTVWVKYGNWATLKLMLNEVGSRLECG